MENTDPDNKPKDTESSGPPESVRPLGGINFKSLGLAALQQNVREAD